MRSRGRCNRGFTLLELMVVVTVIGIVAAMSVPAIMGYTNSSRLAGAMHTLVNDIHLARSLASSQRRTYVLRRSGSGYSLASVSPNATVLSRAMPSGISFTAADSSTFFAWGLTQPATITLQHRGKTRRVWMTASGRVTHD